MRTKIALGLSLFLAACGYSTTTVTYEGVRYDLDYSRDSLRHRLASRPKVWAYFNHGAGGNSLPSPPNLWDTIVVQVLTPLPQAECYKGYSVLLAAEERLGKMQLKVQSVALNCPAAVAGKISPAAVQQVLEESLIRPLGGQLHR